MKLSKENIAAVADLKPGYKLGQADVAILQEMARRQLAAEAQEPVAYIIQDAEERRRGRPGFLSYDGGISKEDINEYEINITPLYTAPPVAQPVQDANYQQLSDLYHAQEKRLFKIAQRIKGPSFDKYAHSPSQAIDVLEAAIFGEHEACRDAMLKQPSTIQTSGSAVSFGEIKQPASKSLQVPKGWKLLPVEPTEAMLDEFDLIIDYGAEDSKDAWSRLLAAAPQPESD